MKHTLDQWYFFGCFITLLLNTEDDEDWVLAFKWMKAARKHAPKMSSFQLGAFGLGRVDMAVWLSKRRS